MPKYKVRSGQNIYDIALTLHGSVEGIFDLLVSNDWLTMETTLSQGMQLNYHEEFIVNKNISQWLRENNILVRNGDHIFRYLDIDGLMKRHFQEFHTGQLDSIESLSPDEQDVFWAGMITPRLMIRQQGQLSTIQLQLKPDRHLIIDWGDYSDAQIIEGSSLEEIEHCYKGSEVHSIIFYGDFEFYSLNLNNVNGVHYPLGTIIADHFESEINIENLNKLIITK